MKQAQLMQRHMLTVVDAFMIFVAGEFTRIIVVIGVIRFRRWKVTALLKQGDIRT